MIYLTKHETQAGYDAVKDNLAKPQVALTLDNNTVHYQPYVDPCASEIVKTTYEWVEIGGVKWATKNIGALTVTDYGQKFSWGETKGYSNDQVSGTCKSKAFSWADYELGDGGDSSSNMTKYNSTDGKTVLEASDDAATVNMGIGWRTPTSDEFKALGSATTLVRTSDYEGSGVAGIVLTSKSDSSKKLFFPAAGYCYEDSVRYVGIAGNYWSSSLYKSAYKTNAYYMGFNSSDLNWVYNSNRCFGFNVRGVFGE